MGLKCIEFTDGTKLVVFAGEQQPWDDSIRLIPGQVQNYVLKNAFVTAGDPVTGGFVNENLDGKRLTDKDGNIWTFTKTNSTNMRCLIVKQDGSTYTKNLSSIYSAGSHWLSYLVAVEEDERGIALVWGAARPVNRMSRETSKASKYIQAGYVNGQNGQYAYSEDVALVNPSDGFASTTLRNIVNGDPFISIVGLRLGSAEEEQIIIARDYYRAPITSGQQDGTPFLYLSNKAITDLSDESADPYAPGGVSAIGGGTGTFSETGDTIGIPGLPTLSAVDTGFITLFNPTPSQVKQLSAYMWSASFDLDTFKNIVANPMDCILGLSIVPVDPPDAGSKAVTVGNIETDVVLPYLSSQYVEVDCGTLNVQEFWGSYLDYSPYTKMSLYLPYIGIVPLDIDDVMNALITIKYHVDVLSGACVAYVLCNGTQLYTYIGQCSSNVPVTSNDFTNTVNGILGIAGNIGSLVASGGSVGNMISASARMANNAINALKPNIQKSGAMSGTGGLMGVQTPYLICQRPRQSVPAQQNTFTGYPSNITAVLGELSGYTEIDKIHLEGVPCTDAEMSEIMSLLESGVYI